MIRNSPVKAVCLVFELAYDNHIPKDVIQVPLELARLLGVNLVYLIARPNAFQENLRNCLKLVEFGDPLPENDEAFKTGREEELIHSISWQQQAAKEAAKYANVLMIYPHFGYPTVCARTFWLANLLKCRKSAVYLKLDAKPTQDILQFNRNRSFSERIESLKSWLAYFSITAFSAESSSTLENFVIRHPELKDKSFLVKNCPPQVEVHKLIGEQVAVQPRGKNILTVGRLGSYQKATEVLLAAWCLAAPSCPGWKLCLVGSCPDAFRQEWMIKLEEAGLINTVEWLGSVTDREKLLKIYQKAEIFVLPSRYEGAANVLIESICAGCSIIVTAVGEVTSLLSSSDPGLIPIDDPVALATAIIRFASSEVMREEQRIKLKVIRYERHWSIQLKPVAERILMKL